jgi:tRNA dimethylallyltransferase
MENELLPILLIYGPTASGKSALAVELAKSCHGEIINTDSMQVYSGVPVLTAQPDISEQDGIAHHLYGYRNADDPGSVGQWLKAAVRTIKEVRERQNTPILVGGSGLYFEALTKGLATIPAIGEAARREAAALLQDQGIEALRAAVTKIDPQAAERILGDDPQRLLRAYSVFLQTGRALSSFHRDTRPLLAPHSWRGLVLKPERAWLYARIERRFGVMLQSGALDEVRRIDAQSLPHDLPVMKVLGLGPLMGHNNSQIDLNDAIETAVRDTRRYAKRQFTWGSGRFAHWPAITTTAKTQQKEAAMRILKGPPTPAPRPAHKEDAS